MAKGRLLDATMGIARDDDALLGQAVAFFGAAYVPVDLLTSSDPQTDEELLALALQRASFTPVLSGADPSPRQAGIRPSVLPVVRAARGGGFTSVRPDGDGVYRGATVTETFQDRHLGQIAFAALLDELGKPSVEIDPARIVLRGAVHHDVPLRAITIPLDGQGRVLLDWPRAGAEDGFRHLSWAGRARFRPVAPCRSFHQACRRGPGTSPDPPQTVRGSADCRRNTCSLYARGCRREL